MLCDFYDSQDNDRIYKKDDQFPHEDSENEPSEDRIKALGSTDNDTGIPLIEIPEKEEVLSEKKAEKEPAQEGSEVTKTEEPAKKTTKKAKTE